MMSFVTNDIEGRISELRDEIKDYYRDRYDPRYVKELFEEVLPRLALGKCKIILDSLINLLIKNSQKKIENENDDLIGAFYEADFRKNIRDKFTPELENIVKEISFENSDITPYSKVNTAFKALVKNRRTRLEEDIDIYLNKLEEKSRTLCKKIQEYYNQEFSKLCSQYSVTVEKIDLKYEQNRKS